MHLRDTGRIVLTALSLGSTFSLLRITAKRRQLRREKKLAQEAAREAEEESYLQEGEEGEDEGVGSGEDDSHLSSVTSAR